MAAVPVQVAQPGPSSSEGRFVGWRVGCGLTLASPMSPGCLSGEAGDGAGKGHGCQRRAAQPPQAGEPAARAQVRSPVRAASCSAGGALVRDGVVPHTLFGAAGTFPGAQLIAGSSAGTNSPPLAMVPACTRSFRVCCLGACKHGAL